MKRKSKKKEVVALHMAEQQLLERMDFLLMICFVLAL